jgi:hypothetical protein
MSAKRIKGKMRKQKKIQILRKNSHSRQYKEEWTSKATAFKQVKGIHSLSRVEGGTGQDNESESASDGHSPTG